MVVSGLNQSVVDLSNARTRRRRAMKSDAPHCQRNCYAWVPREIPAAMRAENVPPCSFDNPEW
eukprot:2097661-Pyramimonas_sp.AAC.1